jgi:hypothetical protein
MLSFVEEKNGRRLFEGSVRRMEMEAQTHPAILEKSAPPL